MSFTNAVKDYIVGVTGLVPCAVDEHLYENMVKRAKSAAARSKLCSGIKERAIRRPNTMLNHMETLIHNIRSDLALPSLAIIQICKWLEQKWKQIAVWQHETSESVYLFIRLREEGGVVYLVDMLACLDLWNCIMDSHLVSAFSKASALIKDICHNLCAAAKSAENFDYTTLMLQGP